MGNECVHHIDGDQFDNKINNLMLFVNNSEHMRYHHQFRIATLKRETATPARPPA